MSKPDGSAHGSEYMIKMKGAWRYRPRTPDEIREAVEKLWDLLRPYCLPVPLSKSGWGYCPHDLQMRGGTGGRLTRTKERLFIGDIIDAMWDSQKTVGAPGSECNPPGDNKPRQSKSKSTRRKNKRLKKPRVQRPKTYSNIRCSCGTPGCRGTLLKRVKVTKKNRNLMCALFGADYAWQPQPNGCPGHKHVIMLREPEGQE